MDFNFLRKCPRVYHSLKDLHAWSHGKLIDGDIFRLLKNKTDGASHIEGVQWCHSFLHHLTHWVVYEGCLYQTWFDNR